MTHRTSLWFPWLFSLVALAAGPTGAAAPESPAMSPLKLTWPRPVSPPGGLASRDRGEGDSTGRRGPPASGGERAGADGAERLPYGAGFESRQPTPGGSSRRGGMGRGH